MMELSLNLPFGGIKKLISLCKAHLSQRIALWVLISILIIEAIIVWPSYMVRKQELLSELEELAFTVAVPLIRLTEAQVAKVDQQIVTDKIAEDTAVLGQVMYSRDGEELNRFGEVPTIDFAEVEGQDVVRLLSEDGLKYEVAWSPERLNADYYCILRLDASSVVAEMSAYTGRMIGFILVVSGFVTGATMIAVGSTVIIPILQLRDKLLAMGEDQANAQLNLMSIEHNDELGDVMSAFNTMHSQIHERTMRMQAELDVVRTLQRMLLPAPEELQQIEGLDIAGFMEPADEVGGDYYDVLQHNGHVKIGIGDVTGHGLESGVLMLMTQAVVRTLLTSDESNPTRFLSILNRTIYDNVQRMQADKSLTLSLLDYHRSGHVRLSGQHEELIVIRRNGTVELIDTMDLGFPIGLDDEIANFVDEKMIHLQPGDGIVLYTDGIPEAENISGEQYGLERMCGVLEHHWAEPAQAIKQALISDVHQFIGEQKILDDITLLVLKQK
ncbi:MAG: PP2C family protein-serine/threonine phosphatase [Ardenticatenaceae bacterium]